LATFRFILILASAITFAGDCPAHPDLMAQIELLDEQMEVNPQDADLLLKRGDLHRRHEDYQSSRRDFDAASNLTPRHELLDFYLGRLDFETGNPEPAELLLDKYLRTHTQHAMAWKLRGEISLALDHPGQAVAYFQNAIERSAAPSPDLYRQQVLSRVASGEAHWSDALAIARQGLEHFGLEVTLLGLGVDISLASGDIEAAEQFLSRLPPGLQKLPAWQVRLEIQECLSLEEQNGSGPCRIRAMDRLAQVLAEFLTDYQTN